MMTADEYWKVATSTERYAMKQDYWAGYKEFKERLDAGEDEWDLRKEFEGAILRRLHDNGEDAFDDGSFDLLWPTELFIRDAMDKEDEVIIIQDDDKLKSNALRASVAVRDLIDCVRGDDAAMHCEEVVDALSGVTHALATVEELKDPDSHINQVLSGLDDASLAFHKMRTWGYDDTIQKD